MKVQTDSNLLFDSSHPDCLCIIERTQGKEIAFIQCLDLGVEHCRHKKPIPKRYWGLWDENRPEESLDHIMRRGGKWPQLPK